MLSKALAPAVSAKTGASKATSSVGDTVSETASSVAGTAGAATSGVRRKAKMAKRSVAEALPGLGEDPVTSLMQQADHAAEQARKRRHGRYRWPSRPRTARTMLSAQHGSRISSWSRSARTRNAKRESA